MEALGGMGYVEDTPLPMLYREAPLNGIWEGSGNVICLDVLRTLAREPAASEVLRAELQAAAGQDARYDAALRDFSRRWHRGIPETEARAFCTTAAMLLSAAQLLRHSPPAVASGYLSMMQAGATGIIGSTGDIGAKAVLARSASAPRTG
jgi:putative acyl-CoA dehydrogenase